MGATTAPLSLFAGCLAGRTYKTKLNVSYMRLITLNIWGGKLLEPLLEFVKTHAKDTDIFCFQEMSSFASDVPPVYSIYRTDTMTDFTNALPEFRAYFDPFQEINRSNEPNMDQGKFSLGNAIFIRSDIKVNHNGHIFIHKHKNAWTGDPEPLPRNLQHIHISNGNQDYTIANFHGLRIKDYGKGDHPGRLEQSKNIIEFLETVSGKKVLVGDMNLNPDTESMKILEQGMINLIKEHGITSTRSRFYEKPGKFADYILVSLDVRVKKFTFMRDEVSDHLPLLLEFD